jgi:hypothetical protein
MGKFFVRERTKIGQGAGLPRFAIVAVSGVDLKVYHSHVRKSELEKLAEDVGAEIVYLPRGEGQSAEEPQHGHGMGKGRRHNRSASQE